MSSPLAESGAASDPNPVRLPRVMNLPGILTAAPDDDNNPAVASPEQQRRRIIVSNHLPILASKDPVTSLWSFSWDPDPLPFQLRSGLPSAPSSTLHVGTLRCHVDPSDHDRVSSLLWDRFRCLPVFLPPELHRDFYHRFCKHYLWPLLHYHHSSLAFDRSRFGSYLTANKLFADKIMEAMSSSDDIGGGDDLVWAHDYHLMALPAFLRKRHPRVRLGFFLHSPFPSSDTWRAFPAREDLLRALLNADLLGFHTFDYARHFLSSCSRLLGAHHSIARGRITVEYYGRTVEVKILAAGIDAPRLERLVSAPEARSKLKEIEAAYGGRILVLGVDDLDVFKGIGLKLLAVERLFELRSELVGRLVMVQIANPARSAGRDVDEAREEMVAVADRVNRRFGRAGYKPVVILDAVPAHEKAAYYAAAECCVVSPVRDGMNLVPYEYTVCRERSEHRRSAIVVSEFVGCSPSLSGAIRVNPWNVDATAEAIGAAVMMPEAEKRMRHEKHYKYVSSHDVAYWARSFDRDLRRACADHDTKRCWGIGFGLSFRVVALGPNFRKLAVEHIVSAYRRSTSRLILLDYDGTMMPDSSIDKAPGEEVISVLDGLCSDPKNVVFVVSGRGKEPLGSWFAPCARLGISAEHGYFTRWTRDSPWESCRLAADIDWKKIAEPVMKHYTEATDGSYIEHKESAMVWHHQEADPDFGSWQAKELLDHLENVLANEPVAVKRGQYIVEVNPQGISKGVVVENLISKMSSIGKPADFILCIGDDRSDEDMFESITRAANDPSFPAIAQVFDCTVGKKPSKAKYYLDDTVDVMKLLRGLASASAQPATKGPSFPVSFEGSL